MRGRVDTIIRVKQSVYRTRIQHIHGSMRLCTLALVARVGALIVVIFVALGVAAVVSDVMGRDLFATSRASTDLIQIVLHTGLVGWALHSSANPPPQLMVNSSYDTRSRCALRTAARSCRGSGSEACGCWVMSLPLRSFVRVS